MDGGCDLPPPSCVLDTPRHRPPGVGHHSLYMERLVVGLVLPTDLMTAPFESRRLFCVRVRQTRWEPLVPPCGLLNRDHTHERCVLVPFSRQRGSSSPSLPSLGIATLPSKTSPI